MPPADDNRRAVDDVQPRIFTMCQCRNGTESPQPAFMSGHIA